MMAENQSAHRIYLEKTVIRGDNKRANWGLFCGYSLCIMVLIMSFILIRGGHDVAGTVLGTADLVSLVSVFVYGTNVRRKERERREDKNRALTHR
jgi:putative copper export protein